MISSGTFLKSLSDEKQEKESCPRYPGLQRSWKAESECRLAEDLSLRYWREKAEISKGRSLAVAMLSHVCCNFELASTANGILACVNLQHPNIGKPEGPCISDDDEYWFSKPGLMPPAI